LLAGILPALGEGLPRGWRRRNARGRRRYAGRQSLRPAGRGRGHGRCRGCGGGGGIWIGRTVLNLSRYRYTMAFGIHALRIAHIVALLADRTRGPGCVCSRQPTRQRARTGANRGALPAAQSRACRCPKPGTDGGASHSADNRGPARRSARLFISELPADVVIVAKLVKTSAIARQGHHAGARRHAYATSQGTYC
jgi:hypothetical protein